MVDKDQEFRILSERRKKMIVFRIMLTGRNFLVLNGYLLPVIFLDRNSIDCNFLNRNSLLYYIIFW